MAAAARLAEIARLDSSEPALSEKPVTTAVAFRSFFIRSAIPSRIALAMLVSLALLASKKISSRVNLGVGAGGAGGFGAGVTTSVFCSMTTGAEGGGGGTTTGGGGGGGQAA